MKDYHFKYSICRKETNTILKGKTVIKNQPSYKAATWVLEHLLKKKYDYTHFKIEKSKVVNRNRGLSL